MKTSEKVALNAPRLWEDEFFHEIINEIKQLESCAAEAEMKTKMKDKRIAELRSAFDAAHKKVMELDKELYNFRESIAAGPWNYDMDKAPKDKDIMLAVLWPEQIQNNDPIPDIRASQIRYEPTYVKYIAWAEINMPKKEEKK